MFNSVRKNQQHECNAHHQHKALWKKKKIHKTPIEVNNEKLEKEREYDRIKDSVN